VGALGVATLFATPVHAAAGGDVTVEETTFEVAAQVDG